MKPLALNLSKLVLIIIQFIPDTWSLIYPDKKIDYASFKVVTSGWYTIKVVWAPIVFRTEFLERFDALYLQYAQTPINFFEITENGDKSRIDFHLKNLLKFEIPLKAHNFKDIALLTTTTTIAPETTTPCSGFFCFLTDLKFNVKPYFPEVTPEMIPSALFRVDELGKVYLENNGSKTYTISLKPTYKNERILQFFSHIFYFSKVILSLN